MKQPKIVGIGEVVWDMLPDGKRLGGAPVNFAFYAKELGARSSIISAVGRDCFGAELLLGIHNLGIDISAVQHTLHPTGTVDITLSGDGIPHYKIREQVAWDFLEHTEATERVITDADALCWGSLAQRNEVSRRAIATMITAAPAQCLKVFDINIRLDYFNEEVILRSLTQADVLKLNEDELPLVARLLSLEGDEHTLIKGLAERFSLSHVIYTKGAACSMVFSRDGQYSCIATPHVEVVDTVGAGDAFTSTFATSLLQEIPIEECHRRAVEIAAFVCTRSGAITLLPHPKPQPTYEYA